MVFEMGGFCMFPSFFKALVLRGTHIPRQRMEALTQSRVWILESSGILCYSTWGGNASLSGYAIILIAVHRCAHATLLPTCVQSLSCFGRPGLIIWILVKVTFAKTTKTTTHQSIPSCWIFPWALDKRIAVTEVLHTRLHPTCENK